MDTPRIRRVRVSDTDTQGRIQGPASLGTCPGWAEFFWYFED
jgi:hypothetical protein